MNPVVGDLDGNRERILARLDEARPGADLALFPRARRHRLPPWDLLCARVPARRRAGLDAIAAGTKGIAALVGTPHLDRDLFNACAVCVDGEVEAIYRKLFLPNYGVFDEDRYFQPGRDLAAPALRRDARRPDRLRGHLAAGAARHRPRARRRHVIANISASPFHLGKGAEREEMLATRARDNSCWIVFVNAVGAQDELIFDGHSLVLDEEGEVVVARPAFEEALLLVDVDPTTAVARRLRDARRRALPAPRRAPDPPVIELPATGREADARAHPRPAVGRARGDAARLELGLRDYVEKNGFRRSSWPLRRDRLRADRRARRRGARPERVVCVSMPSRYSSDATRTTPGLAERLGARSSRSRSSRVVDAIGERSRDPSRAREPGLAEENVQARAPRPAS